MENKDLKKKLLKDIMKEMDGMMAEPLKGMKKVSVVAKDSEGLKEGLEKAEDMMGPEEQEESCEKCSGAGCEACEEPESSEEEKPMDSMMPSMSDDEDEDMISDDAKMSVQEINDEIKRLKQLKLKKLGM